MSSLFQTISGWFGLKRDRSVPDENPAYEAKHTGGLPAHDNWTTQEGGEDWKDLELVNLSGDSTARVPCTRGMLLTNTHITGKTGSGKSSSILPAIIRPLLADFWGMYVFVVKAEDINKWKEMAAEAGRSEDLIIVRPGPPEKEAQWRFNFLEYCSPWGRVSSITLVNLFKEIASAQAPGKFGGGGGDSMDFFQRKFEQLISACVDALLIFKGKVSLQEIDEIIKTAPRDEKQAKDQLEHCCKAIYLPIEIKLLKLLSNNDDIAQEIAIAENKDSKVILDRLISLSVPVDICVSIAAFLKTLADFNKDKKAERIKQLIKKKTIEFVEHERILEEEGYNLSSCLVYCLKANLAAKTTAQKADATRALDYFLRSFAPEAPKQRDGAIGIWDGLSAPLLRGEINQIFNTYTNFTPDDAWEKGKIIIMAIPSHEFLEAGVLVQVMWKYIVQRAIEKRTPSKLAEYPRPVLLVADEAQEVFSKNDCNFVRVCRSYRAGMLYLTQAIANYESKLGSQSRYVVETLLASFKQRFWGTSDCDVTNTFAQKSIGKGIQRLFNSSHNTSFSLQNLMTPTFSSSGGSGESVIDLIQTSEFVTLSTVCAETAYTAEFIYQRAGEKLPNGKSYMKVAFRGELSNKKYQDMPWEDDSGETPAPPPPDPDGRNKKSLPIAGEWQDKNLSERISTPFKNGRNEGNED